MKLIRINIGGKTREFRFGLGFIGLFLESTKIKMDEIDAKVKENPFKVIPEMMYYSLIFACRRNQEEIDFDTFDVSEWIDELGGLDSKEVVEFYTAFYNSMIKDVPNIPEDKKKVM